MKRSAEALRPARRALGRNVVPIALLAIGLAAPACSKKPTAPKIPGPTRFVVFSSDRNRTPGNVRTQLCKLDGRGTDAYVFNSSASVLERHPSVTLDGNVICYQMGPGRGGSQDVILYQRSPVSSIDDPNVNSTLDEADPYLSLDGKRLAFARDSTDGSRIHLYDLTTHLLIPLPGLDGPAGTNDWAPALDAAGRRLAFVTDRNGTADVMVYQVTTGTFLPVPLAASPSADIEPCLSGDGRYVAWASNKTGGQGNLDVYVFDLLNDLLVPTTANTSGDERHPSMSVDGSYMVFESNFPRPSAPGGYDIWNLNIPTGTIWQVVDENQATDDIDPVLVWP
jgi:Tol biopolymer transport system component